MSGIKSYFLNLIFSSKLKEELNKSVLEKVVKNNVDPAFLFKFHHNELHLIDYNNKVNTYFPNIGKRTPLVLRDLIATCVLTDETYENIVEDTRESRKIFFECRKEFNTNYYLKFRGSPLLFEGTKYYLFSIIDITQSNLRKHYLKETEKKYREMFDNSPIALWEQDFSEILEYIRQMTIQDVNTLEDVLTKNEEIIVRFVSLIKITSLNQKTLDLFEAHSLTQLREFDLNGNLYKIFSPEMYQTYIDLILSLYSGEKYFQKETEVFTLNRKRLQLMFRSTRLNEEDDWSKIEISMEDITEKTKLLNKLHNMAHEDALTGLNNRRGFTILAGKQLQIAKRALKKLTLLFIDMDDMKSINDKYGHDEGDIALKNLAGIMKNTFRESDILARIGGDEFCGLLTNPGNETTEMVKSRLKENIKKHNAQSKKPYKIEISIGLSEIYPSEENQLEDLLKATDSLMYKEKRKKCNTDISCSSLF